MPLPPDDDRLRGNEHIDSWLMSYADMVTLLLCFFVIIVSLSKPVQNKLDAATDSLRKEFGKVENPANKKDLPKPEYLTGDDLLILHANGPVIGDIEKVLTASPQTKSMASVTETEDGAIIIELKSTYFYESGSSDFKNEGREILSELADKLAKPDYQKFLITVEGHTDDTPIKTERYPSNWELSTARATGVIRFLIDRGFDPKRLKAAGYADSLPKVPNRDASGTAIPENQAQNRRVVIKLERPPEKKQQD